MSRLLCTAALLVAASSAGCVFYTGDDDTGDDICAYDDYPAYELRNPETGACEAFGGGGCYGDPELSPDWASCYTACEDLDELTCLGTPACRAAYSDYLTDCGPEEDCGGGREFLGCWGTAPSGPVQGECWGLDAHECSRHDDCAAVYRTEYAGDDGTYQTFAYCEPEPYTLGCYSDEECPAGYECTADTECLPPPGCEDGETCPAVCYGRCVPTTGCDVADCPPGTHCELYCSDCDPTDPDGTCESECKVVCVPDGPTCDDGTVCPDGTHCETRCEDCIPEDGEVCPEYCWTECVPDDPPSCEGVDCGPGYHCEEQCECPPCDDGDPACGEPCWCGPVCVPGILDHCWSGFCIPIEDCGPNDPGECFGEVFCDMAEPSCPEGTTPGISGGCYTGYCIPLWACDLDRSCESIGTEEECVARADCEAIYEGWGCTCTPDGVCTCDELLYSHCQSGGGGTDPGEPTPGG